MFVPISFINIWRFDQNVMVSNPIGVRNVVLDTALSKYPRALARKALLRMKFFSKVCYATCKHHTAATSTWNAGCSILYFKNFLILPLPRLVRNIFLSMWGLVCHKWNLLFTHLSMGLSTFVLTWTFQLLLDYSFTSRQ